MRGVNQVEQVVAVVMVLRLNPHHLVLLLERQEQLE
jgi:hypothetical protein